MDQDIPGLNLASALSLSGGLPPTHNGRNYAHLLYRGVVRITR